MRIGVFFLLFGLVLALTTVAHDHGGLAFGSHAFSSYGWPERWLTIDRIDKTSAIHPDGRQEGGERGTSWSIGFTGLLASVGTAAGLAVLWAI